ncbi:MAG: hypothetical protein BWK80_36145 [Desulfobacteraceae bacterium IS3]|nr:MAG: hypothetical protein BWK80_36145 [Desulfobacteraceae bacterium IS3]
MPVKTKMLRRNATPEEYLVYRAGIEWDLTDPIVIKNRKDIKSAYRWQDLVDPYEHQVKNLITFCQRLPVTLLADDVGLGKTVSAGVIISELIVRSRVSKVLIVCPKLLGPQWQEELKTKFRISSESLSMLISMRTALSLQPIIRHNGILSKFRRIVIRCWYWMRRTSFGTSMAPRTRLR